MLTTTSEHVLGITPKPASRPKFRAIRLKSGQCMGSAYDDPAYKAHKDALAALLPPLNGEPALEDELAMAIEFVCEPIAKSKFTTPKGDLDNFAKALMDVLTQQGWYSDDRQIVSLHLTKRFPDSDEEPHIRFQLTALT